MSNLLLDNFHVTTLSNGRKTIKVYELVHVAPQAFYDVVKKLVDEDKGNGFVTHIEGIKKTSKTPASISDVYRNLSKALGVANQVDGLNKNLDNPINHDRSWDDFTFAQRKALTVTFFTISVFTKIIEKIPEGDEKDKFVSDFFNQVVEEDVKSREEKLEESNFVGKLARNIILSDNVTINRSVHAAQYAFYDARNVSLLWGKAHAEEIIDWLTSVGYKVEKTEAYSELVD